MSHIASYLIPLVDEARHAMTLTCQACGATTDPVLVTEDGDDYVVPPVPFYHRSSCPFFKARGRFVRLH